MEKGLWCGGLDLYGDNFVIITKMMIELLMNNLFTWNPDC